MKIKHHFAVLLFFLIWVKALPVLAAPSNTAYVYIYGNQKFPSRTAAESVMRSGPVPRNEYKLIETRRNQGNQNITYVYTIPHVQRVTIGSAKYWIDGSCQFPWCGSEAEAVNARKEALEKYWCNVELSSAGGSQPGGYGGTSANPGQVYEIAYIPYTENKTYKNSKGCTDIKYPEENRLVQSWTPISSCPTGYVGYATGSGPNMAFCKPLINKPAYIEARALQASCEPKGGNPCGILTGTKTETELDIAAEDLEFVRNYSSDESNISSSSESEDGQ